MIACPKKSYSVQEPPQLIVGNVHTSYSVIQSICLHVLALDKCGAVDAAIVIFRDVVHDKIISKSFQNSPAADGCPTARVCQRKP